MDDPINTSEAAAILGKDPRTLEQWRENSTGPAWERTEDGRIVYSRWVVECYSWGDVPKGDQAEAACDRMMHSSEGLAFLRAAMERIRLKPMPTTRKFVRLRTNEHSRMFSPPDSPYTDDN